MGPGKHAVIQVWGMGITQLNHHGPTKHTEIQVLVPKAYINKGVPSVNHTGTQVWAKKSTQGHKSWARQAYKKKVSVQAIKKQHTYLVYSNTGVKPGKHAGIQVWGNGNIEKYKYGARKAYRNTSNKKVNR